MKRLQGIKGVKVKIPEGAFYLMPEVSAFCGPQVQAKGFGAIPDVDSLCRWFPIYSKSWSLPFSYFYDKNRLRSVTEGPCLGKLAVSAAYASKFVKVEALM